MRQAFKGWKAVARHLEALAAAEDRAGWSLNHGQQASLRALSRRLTNNGVVIADEVGMGKTRIAVALAHSVIKAGGRVAILVPPGLGFQWQDELRSGGVGKPTFVRSLWGFLEAWGEEAQHPWFAQDLLLISHAFSNWRLGKSSSAWRWGLLPALYGKWQRQVSGRHPKGFGKLLLGKKQPLPDRWAQYPLRAAESIAVHLSQLPENHPARSLMTGLYERASWPEVMDPGAYGRHADLRDSLEQAVGLGFGVFDLVIIDEAHKSRGNDSALNRLIEKVILQGPKARRMAMTATPVELDATQWHNTLARIGVPKLDSCTADGDIFKRYANACDKVRKHPHSDEHRNEYRKTAAQFEQMLKPYLLRRDKRELEVVQAFARHSQGPLHGYRHELEITVDTQALSGPWKQAVCAAEALSIVSRQADDPASKRLRLTMGNGHGIATLLDHGKRDATLDSQQEEHDLQASNPTAASAPTEQADKRQQRAHWWRSVIANAFSRASDPLFEHPAILAAVAAIEEAGEKVLVFGRFTAPLQALVQLLNARAMLRALERRQPWPQTTVHNDEWPAIQAAHRQLGLKGEANREALDRQLARQYRKLEEARQQKREHLLERLGQGLTAYPQSSMLHSYYKALCSANADHDGQGELPLVQLARALHELAADDESPGSLATAFEDLIGALREPGEDSDDTSTSVCWSEVSARIKDEYSRSESGFARLMYGGTAQDTRRLLQLAFNRSGNPRVLVAQSMVGREGLNLHKACKTVVLLHPEWNPGVVEQQIGRVDRVGSLWESQLRIAIDNGQPLPRILVRPVVFKGTYDESNWSVLRKRWDDLCAQLHGVVISAAHARSAGLDDELVGLINDMAPRFSPVGED